MPSPLARSEKFNSTHEHARSNSLRLIQGRTIGATVRYVQFILFQESVFKIDLPKLQCKVISCRKIMKHFS